MIRTSYLLPICFLVFACGGKQSSVESPQLQQSESNTPEVSDTISDAGTTPTPDIDTPNNQVIELETMRIEVFVDDKGQEQTIVVDARGLLDEGNDALASGEFSRAIEAYDDLLTDFADSSLVGAAQYNAGLAFEGLGDIASAVGRYQRIASLHVSDRDAIDAQVRIAALYAEKERWAESLAALESILTNRTLQPSDRIEVLARKGYVLLESKDYVEAEKTLRTAIAFYQSSNEKDSLDGGYYVGMVFFYLGDIARRQFDDTPIRLPEEQMARDVEAKAVLTNLASERFGDTIQTMNIYWSTAAGFRLAELQHNFWKALVSAPIPPHLDSLSSSIYVKEVHKYSLVFLEKALSIHGKNVQLATLYRGQTNWSRASAGEVVRLTALLGREKSGELVKADELAIDYGNQRESSEEYVPMRIDL